MNYTKYLFDLFYKKITLVVVLQTVTGLIKQEFKSETGFESNQLV